MTTSYTNNLIGGPRRREIVLTWSGAPQVTPVHSKLGLPMLIETTRSFALRLPLTNTQLPRPVSSVALLSGEQRRLAYTCSRFLSGYHFPFVRLQDWRAFVGQPATTAVDPYANNTHKQTRLLQRKLTHHVPTCAAAAMGSWTFPLFGGTTGW